MRKGGMMGKIFGAGLVFVMIGAMLGGLSGTVLPFGSFDSQSYTLAQETKTWYVDDDKQDYPAADFTKIQDAVDAANSGDTIIVYPDTYTENVKVNKDHLIIESENVPESTIVQAADPHDYVFEVTADCVNITGFTVKGGSESAYAGIYLHYADDCIISDNNCSNTGCGIYLDNCCVSALRGNTVSNNADGIWFFCSSGNSLINNIIFDNRWNFGVNGRGLSHFDHNIDTSNTVNGKPIQYFCHEEGLVIDSSWDVGYLGIVDCTNMTVKDLTLSSNRQGRYCWPIQWTQA